MDLKNILKNLKLNENNLSMLLGAGVVIVVGFLVVNYFRNLESGTTLPTGGTTTEDSVTKLPTKHTVKSGESLWTIAEQYYKSGYNWVDIQKANNLTNASIITTGQELVIPDVQAMTATVQNAETATTSAVTPLAMETTAPTPTEVATTATPEAPVVTATPAPTNTAVTTTAAIEGNTYTVVHGDNLWTIAVRAYGDGYKWTEVAKANKLLQPGVIHAGNVLNLPR